MGRRKEIIGQDKARKIDPVWSRVEPHRKYGKTDAKKKISCWTFLIFHRAPFSYPVIHSRKGFIQFFHSPNKTCPHLPGTDLNLEDTAVNVIEKVLPSWSLWSSDGRKTINKFIRAREQKQEGRTKSGWRFPHRF